MSLRLIRYLFILIGILYLLSPYDLLPDFTGLIGRLDDLLVACYLIYQYHRIKRRTARVEETHHSRGNSGGTAKTDRTHANAHHARFDYERAHHANQGWKKNTEEDHPQSKESAQFDPYAVFSLSPQASMDEIEARYRELMKKYHPDRVTHLGAEFQKLAHERTVEIQRAFEMLGQARRGKGR